MNKTYQNPVCAGADPYILLYDGTYYLYATNAPTQGYKVFRSDDLIHWEDCGFCLKCEDVKGEIKEENGRVFGFWAPEVIHYHGKFYMIYTVNIHLGVAVSDSPLGPFVQREKKWIFEKNAIDGHFFVDDDDTVYLIYRCRKTNRIAGVKMNPDMNSVDQSTDTLLLSPGEFPWEHTIPNQMTAEGPYLLKHKGKYYLSYSANDYRNIDYAIGYAVSDHPLGEYKKYDGNPILKRSETVYGTGHHSFTTSKDGKQLVCVYHCHHSTEKIDPRMTCIDRAEFVPAPNDGEDILVIHGPTSEPVPVINP